MINTGFIVKKEKLKSKTVAPMQQDPPHPHTGCVPPLPLPTCPPVRASPPHPSVDSGPPLLPPPSSLPVASRLFFPGGLGSRDSPPPSPSARSGCFPGYFQHLSISLGCHFAHPAGGCPTSTSAATMGRSLDSPLSLLVPCSAGPV